MIVEDYLTVEWYWCKVIKHRILKMKPSRNRGAIFSSPIVKEMVFLCFSLSQDQKFFEFLCAEWEAVTGEPSLDLQRLCEKPSGFSSEVSSPAH